MRGCKENVTKGNYFSDISSNRRKTKKGQDPTLGKNKAEKSQGRTCAARFLVVSIPEWQPHWAKIEKNPDTKRAQQDRKNKTVEERAEAFSRKK